MTTIKENRYNIFWDHENEVPVIDLSVNKKKDGTNGKGFKYLTTDARPVFLEEKHLLLTLFPEFGNAFYFKSVWGGPGNAIFIDGKRVSESVAKRGREADLQMVRESVKSFTKTKKMIKAENEIIERFISVNKGHLLELLKSEERDDEGCFIGAEPFIRETISKYPNRMNIVSFSGGKDSIAVSRLVTKAINNPSVLHIFGDTTLEMPNTYGFVERFQKKNPMTPFFIEKNEDSNFFDMCKQIGPPSRVKTWCCSIFKTGPIGTTLAELDEKVLTFYGIRRNESASRSKYTKVGKSPKLEKQVVASPIIDWIELDIWLYILFEGVDFNDAYKQGFSRVGCWLCPNGSGWSDFLASIYMGDDSDRWNSFLVDFAKGIGKQDAEDYIRDGKWKARQGGDGIEFSSHTKIKSEDCITKSETAKTYNLTRPINQDFFELFKPFGNLNFDIGNKRLGEIFILNRKKEPIFKLIAKEGQKSFRLILLITDRKELNKQYPQKVSHNFFGFVDKQVRKFQICINCKACDGTCPTGAIEVTPDRYYIDEKKCINCLKCVNHFTSGCIIASALVTKGK